MAHPCRWGSNRPFPFELCPDATLESISTIPTFTCSLRRGGLLFKVRFGSRCESTTPFLRKHRLNTHIFGKISDCFIHSKNKFSCSIYVCLLKRFCVNLNSIGPDLFALSLDLKLHDNKTTTIVNVKPSDLV